MILIVTNKNDLTVDYFITKIEKNTNDFFRLNTENFIKDYSFKFDLTNNDNSWSIKNKLNKKEIGSNSISGIWYRRPKLPHLIQSTDSRKVDYELMLEAKNYYDDFIRTINTKWLSHPDYIRSAENKIQQLVVAKKLGFLVPNTLLSNNVNSAKIFCNGNDQISTKPLRNGSYTSNKKHYIMYNRTIDNDDIKNIHLISNYPVLLQKYIPKIFEVRVVIVNNKIFAVKIDSQLSDRTSEDWRVDNCHNVKYSRFKLPLEIQERCFEIVRYFNLNFSSMDLICSDNGSYYFLDLNPNGQWGWLDIELDLGISEAILDFFNGA